MNDSADWGENADGPASASNILRFEDVPLGFGGSQGSHHLLALLTESWAPDAAWLAVPDTLDVQSCPFDRRDGSRQGQSQTSARAYSAMPWITQPILATRYSGSTFRMTIAMVAGLAYPHLLESFRCADANMIRLPDGDTKTCCV